MNINYRQIGDEYPPFIIAEMSANHNGNINNKFKIIDKENITKQMPCIYRLINQKL
tara:strand:+ start:411 stop:578 length:168 start_codon:yes stop_codon:yes gene_type:complete